MNTDAMSSNFVLSALRACHPMPKWAFAAEVSNATGALARRRCDALAMSVWPSEGLHLHGYEIKVSRSDWLREMQDPNKSTPFFKHCHFWWIVAPKGIVKLEELPEAWGLKHVNDKGGVRVAKPCVQQRPEPISHTFLASLFRAVQTASDLERDIKAAEQRGYQKGRDETATRFESRDKAERSHLEHELARVKASLADFQTVSGINIEDYNGRSLGNLVRTVQRLDLASFETSLTRISRTLAELVERANAAAAAIRHEQAEMPSKGGAA